MDILSVGFICQTRLVDTGSLVECSSVFWVVQFTILSHMAFVCVSVGLYFFFFYCCLWIFVVWIKRLIDWLIDYSEIVEFVCKTRRFSDIRLWIMSWPWNRGQRSLKVIVTDTDRSVTYDFLLTFYSNHGPISHRFRDRRRFQSKIAKFSHQRVFCAPADAVPLGIGYRRKGSKTRMKPEIKKF